MPTKILGGMLMAQATRSGQLNFSDYVERALREGALWTLMCVALYLVLSLVSYVPDDPGWSYVGETSRVSNTGGRTGAWFADVTLYLFGYFAYLLPLMVGFSAWVLFRGREEDAAPRAWMLAMRWIGFVLTLAAGCGYATMHFAAVGTDLPNGSGGGLGHAISGLMLDHFGQGTEVLLAGLLLVGVTLFTGISWLGLLYSLGDGLLQGLRAMGAGLRGGLSVLARRRGESVAAADRGQIVQVIQNLVENAVKYTADGGSVMVEVIGDLATAEAATAVGDLPARFSILTPDRATGKRYVVVRVRDFGPGIDRNHLPRLTERFYRVEGQKVRDRPGTGLGLAIVKHILNRHRGGLIVESGLGVGTRFTAYVPKGDAAGA